MIVAVAALLSFLGTGFYSYSRGIFLPSLADALDNGERFGISMGFSAAAVTGAIVAPYIGRYLDHGSARKVLLLGTIIVTTCYVLLAMIGNMIQYFLVVSIGMGVGMVCMGGQAWHRSIISWFDHWRGRAISFSVLGASLAGIAMPPVVNALIELYGWRNAYLVFGGTTLVMLFPMIYLFMKDRPEEVGEVRDGRAYVERHTNDVIEIEEDVRVWTFARNVSITSVLEYRRDLRFHDLRIHRGDDALVLASTRHWYRLVYRLVHYVSHNGNLRCSR